MSLENPVKLLGAVVRFWIFWTVLILFVNVAIIGYAVYWSLSVA